MTLNDKLTKLKRRKKFSKKAWNERGLQASNSAVCKKLDNFFNNCIHNLMTAVKDEGANKKLKQLLEKELSSLNKSDFDSEEREYIADLFIEMASIVDIDLNNTLEEWLYGSIPKIKEKKILETRIQTCSKCKAELKSHVLKKNEKIKEVAWMLGRCKQCEELNLLSFGSNIKEARTEGFAWLGSLYKDEYTPEEVKARLEEIKQMKKVEFKMSW